MTRSSSRSLTNIYYFTGRRQAQQAEVIGWLRLTQFITLNVYRVAQGFDLTFRQFRHLGSSALIRPEPDR